MNAVSIVGVVSVFGLVFLWLLALCAEKGVCPLGRVRQGFRRMPGWKKALILIFVSVWIAFAGTKDGTNGVGQVEGETNTVTNVEGTNNVGQIGGEGTNGTLFVGGPLMLGAFGRLNLTQGVTTVITDDDVAQLWRISAMFDANSFAAPTANAVTNAAWSDYGGLSDSLRIRQAGWRFPFGAKTATGLTVFESGEFRPNVKTHFFPTPFDAKLSLLPRLNWGLLPNGGESVFWHEQTPSNSLILTWHNALYGRDVNSPTNFQAELFADGRFDYRYPDRTVQYAPVFPFDWDGDGLENSVDPEPLVAGPDAHGTNAEWYNRVCGGVFMAFAGPDGIDLEPKAAEVNTNAYYFVKVVAESLAPVFFRADGPSRLGSPVVVARAGETNCVPLLIGAHYCVSSSVPITVTAPDGAVVERTGDWEQPAFDVCWPVAIEFASGADGSVESSVDFETHDRLGGIFCWTGGCCVVTEGARLWYGCEGCGCGGCQAQATYTYECYSLTRDGPTCACEHSGGGSGIGSTDPEPQRADADIVATSAEVSDDPHDPLPVRWIALVGRGTAGTAAATNGTIRIPAGRTCFVGAFVASTEHPTWTARMAAGTDSRYDDTYRYSVSAGRTRLQRRGRVSALHAAFGAGRTAHDVSPVAYSGGSFFQAPTGTALDVAFSLEVANADDGLRPTALMLGVFPLSLVQSNYPVVTNGVDGVHPTTVVRNGETNEVVVVTNRTRSGAIRVVTNDFASATDFGIYTNRLVRRDGVAYITGRPAAPQLTAKVRGLPDWVPVRWRGTLRSERAERRNLDNRDYAPTNTAGDVALDVTAWMNELVGGKFSLTVQATNAPAANTAFSIRGKNPRDGAALDRLVTDIDEEFRSFAWRIAQHETARWSRRGTYLFNQFNPISGRQGALKELPNRGAPDGWGIGQIDRSGNTTGTTDVLTREVYNWKTNIVSMNTVLRAKKRIYEWQIGCYRGAYGNLPNWCEPNVTTNLGGRIVTAREWGIMTCYNGTMGCPRETAGGYTFFPPVIFHPATGTWTLHKNTNDYVTVVMTNVIHRTTEY